MSKFKELLELYEQKKYPTLIARAMGILRNEGLLIVKHPLIYDVEKLEGYAHSYLIVSIYVGGWRVYMKIDDADNIEKGVSR